jgi:tetratricopeptide (TPR) repeat protein
MHANHHRATRTTTTRTTATQRITMLLAIGLWAGQTFAAPAAAEPEQPGPDVAPRVPVEDLSGSADATPPASAPGENPAARCYFAARSDTAHGGADEATYACDLAVRMARDAAAASGNAAVIAALTNRALVLARTGRPEPALEDLDAALALAPDDPRLHGNRGNLLLRLGRLQDALAAQDRAVTLAPRDPEVYYNRAFVYRALGEPGLAAEDVARARQLLPGNRR